MNLKQLFSVMLCALLVFAICACGTVTPLETTLTGSELMISETKETTTAEETTTLPIYATSMESTVPQIPIEEAANAIPVHADAVIKREIPLLVILVSYDANGNGRNDWDENEPNKLFADSSADYYGEQWISTTIDDHYALYFGEINSVAAYFREMTMGNICFVPALFDVMPENAAEQGGMLSVTVHSKHPSSQSGSNYVNEICKACDTYIDFSKFDANGSGVLESDELCLMVIHPGADASSSSGKKYANASSPRNHFEIWACSMSIGYARKCDGVSFETVANTGEYKTVGTVMPIGTSCHELSHNLGASDLYNVDRYDKEDSLSGWPMPYNFSLQCNGNAAGYGNTPTYLDPFQRVLLGFAKEQVVSDGVYTISSTLSGDYAVLRVNTPDPNEYYLIEVRLKEGYERNLVSGSAAGGIMVWHVDMSIVNSYLSIGMACSSCTNNAGRRHDPGIVPLFRNAYDDAGKMMTTSKPLDPFYYYTAEDTATAICNTGAFRSVMNGTQSLNSYPSNWEGADNYNLCVEVLSEPGQNMTVKITTGNKDYAPVVSADYMEKNHNSITVEGKVEWKNCDISTCGVVLFADENRTTVLKAVTVEPDKDGIYSYCFDKLLPETHYFYKVYVISDNGYAEDISDTYTTSVPKPKETVTISFFRGLTSPDKAFTAKYKFGASITYKFPMNKPGYTFAGWYLDAEFNKPYNINLSIPEGTEDFSLFAKWVPES